MSVRFVGNPLHRASVDQFVLFCLERIRLRSCFRFWMHGVGVQHLGVEQNGSVGLFFFQVVRCNSELCLGFSRRRFEPALTMLRDRSQ